MNRENIPENFQKSSNLQTKATAQMYDGNFLGAISTLDKALELNPISLFAYQYRAICKMHLSMQNNASIKDQRKYLEEIISDLENAKRAARNSLQFLDTSSS